MLESRKKGREAGGPRSCAAAADGQEPVPPETYKGSDPLYVAVADAGFGSYLKLSITGASHAPEMTFRLENFPAGLRVDRTALAAFMERRAPGRDTLSTQRRETDEVVFRSGFSSCAGCVPASRVTTGEPIVGAIANRDMRPGDYGAERTVPRPGHADFGQWIETGRIPTGGGKNSGRLTAPLCAAGGLCREWLERRAIRVEATLAEVGGITGEKAMRAEIEKARKTGDSVDGRVHCRVTNVPAGLGGALFDGLECELSAALFAIPGVKGVTWGEGDFNVGRAALPRGRGRSQMTGSAYNDALVVRDGAVTTATNRAGGILGGRASGMPIEFDVWLKPTPTVFVEQDSVDLATMKPAKIAMKGRHDPCIARRAVPVVEAVAAFVLADLILADEAAHPRICLTLTGRTLAEDLEQYKSQRYFTDLVELRVDLLSARERAKAAKFPAMLWKVSRPGPVVPVIFTFRRTRDGGAYEGSEKMRERFFFGLLGEVGEDARREARDAGRDARQGTGGETYIGSDPLYVDFEEDFHALDGLAREKGVHIVRSLHDFTGPVKRLPARLKKLAAAGDIAKIAFLPRSLADVSRLMGDSRRRGGPDCRRGDLAASDGGETSFSDAAGTPRLRGILLAMGPPGLASRVLAGRLGAPWTYASVGGLSGLGHVTPYELVRDYRFRSTTREAALYGVTGWPLKKTRSPELHNAMFDASDTDAVMIPFPAKTAREAIGFMNALGMKGLAVTIPHKEAVMPLLDRIDPAARRVGAVNTVVREGGKLVGYNTDVAGFAEAITAFVESSREGRALSRPQLLPRCDAREGRAPARPRWRGSATLPADAEVKNLRVAVLGAGGAAKAVVFALKKLGARVEVFHRRPLTAGFDLIVNATPVDPIPDYSFTGRELVYDLVYVPDETPLLVRARAAGCRVENGFSMLVAQAREQQRLFRA